MPTTMFSSGINVEPLRRINHQAATGEAFADIIVGVAFQRQRDAFCEKRAEALSGRAGEVEADGIVRQSAGAELAVQSRR